MYPVKFLSTLANRFFNSRQQADAVSRYFDKMSIICYLGCYNMNSRNRLLINFHSDKSKAPRDKDKR